MSKLEKVLLVGPGIKNGTLGDPLGDPLRMNSANSFDNRIFQKNSSDLLIKTLSLDYAKGNFAIVGNGLKNITLAEINHHNGLVSSSTRFDIMAHGANFTGQHVVRLGEEALQRYPSIDLLELFANLNQDKNTPIYAHLWSCNSTTGKNHIHSLPEGFIIVIHDSNNHLIPIAQGLVALANSKHSPYSFEDFINNMVDYCLLDCELLMHLNNQLLFHKVSFDELDI